MEKTAGAFVELDIEIRGDEDEPVEDAKTNSTFLLDDTTTLDLASKFLGVSNGGEEIVRDIEEGYPAIVTKDTKKVFIFRFGRVDGDIKYDPILRFEPNPEAEPNSASTMQLGGAMLTMSLFGLVSYLVM